MTYRNDNTTRDIDWLTISLYLGLVLTGWLMIYAVGYRGPETPIFSRATRHGSQLVWVGISLVIGIIVMVVDSKFYRTFAYIIYAAMIVALISVLGLGRIISGSKSWIDLGFFRFQPSEFAKFATCLALASFLGGYKVNLQQQFRSQLIALGIISVPMVLVLLQGDAGSALVFTSLLIVLFREGMPPPLYILGGAVTLLSVLSLYFENPLPIVLGITLISTGVLVNTFKTTRPKSVFLVFAVLSLIAFYYNDNKYQNITLAVTSVVFTYSFIKTILNKKVQLAIIVFGASMVAVGYVAVVNYGFNKVLKPHQQDRINVWLNPEKCDPLGALYNVTWSKRAIGSGGFLGKGFLEGNVTKLNYVPEQVTDFIFCTIGEEQGFVGTFAIIMLFLLLLLRIIIIAERQRSKFTRIYAYGVASILFFHLLINVGMTLGIMPVIGIPLPFISYGGSSLLAFTILMSILIRLDSNRLQVFR